MSNFTPYTICPFLLWQSERLHQRYNERLPIERLHQSNFILLERDNGICICILINTVENFRKVFWQSGNVCANSMHLHCYPRFLQIFRYLQNTFGEALMRKTKTTGFRSLRKCFWNRRSFLLPVNFGKGVSDDFKLIIVFLFLKNFWWSRINDCFFIP